MTAHAVFGASSSSRWMSCPGSVELSKGIVEPPSEFAAEGTAAHELSEMVLRTELHTSNWLGEKIEASGFTFTVDGEMVDAVQMYVDFVRDLSAEYGTAPMLEHRFDLSKLQPPAPMFGTADCAFYVEGERLLHIADLKYGRGVPVSAHDNPQLKYYALGMLLSLPADKPVRTVRMSICQPRINNFDNAEISVEELLDFSAELLDAVHAAIKPDAALVPSESACKFCKAKGKCPALRETALTVAQSEFGEILDPAELQPEQIGELLAKADMLEEWLRGLRNMALSQAEAGVEIPGFTLQAKRATRKWVNEDEFLAWAYDQNLEDTDLFERKVKSPAQIEKLVGKKNFNQDLTVSVSSGYNLVPDVKKNRPALGRETSASDDFNVNP